MVLPVTWQASRKPVPLRQCSLHLPNARCIGLYSHCTMAWLQLCLRVLLNASHHSRWLTPCCLPPTSGAACCCSCWCGYCCWCCCTAATAGYPGAEGALHHAQAHRAAAGVCRAAVGTVQLCTGTTYRIWLPQEVGNLRGGSATPSSTYAPQGSLPGTAMQTCYDRVCSLVPKKCYGSISSCCLRMHDGSCTAQLQLHSLAPCWQLILQAAESHPRARVLTLLFW